MKKCIGLFIVMFVFALVSVASAETTRSKVAPPAAAILEKMDNATGAEVAKAPEPAKDAKKAAKKKAAKKGAKKAAKKAPVASVQPAAVPVKAADPLPTHLVIGGGSEAPATKWSISGNVVTVKVPIVAKQLVCKDSDEPGILSQCLEGKSPKWQLYASVAYSTGHNFVLIMKKSDGELAIPTKVEGDFLVGTITLPADKGNGQDYWLVVYGQDKQSSKWLWINQGDPFCRNDKKGNPHYEGIARVAQQTVIAVPPQNDTRP